MRLGPVRFVARRGAREPVETFGQIDQPRAQPRRRDAESLAVDRGRRTKATIPHMPR